MLRDSDKEQAILDIYQEILTFIPGLNDHIEWTQVNDPLGITELAAYVSARNL